MYCPRHLRGCVCLTVVVMVGGGGDVCLPVVGVSAQTLNRETPPPDTTRWADIPLGRPPSVQTLPLSRHPPLYHTPPPSGQTDDCENITFPHTSYAVDKKVHFGWEGSFTLTSLGKWEQYKLYGES